jgi:hypothetical protein
MAKPAFRSPTSLPVAAAVIPARLAAAHDDVLWRELPGGEIEVAARIGKRVERLRVHHDATTTQLGTSIHRRWLIKAVLFGGLALGAALVVTALGADRTLGIALLVLFIALAVANDYADSLARHLKRELGVSHEWHAPTRLHGWTPKSTPQLAAVEELANKLGGPVYVAADGAVTEVIRGSNRYLLDDEGDLLLHEKTRWFRPIKRDNSRTWVVLGTYVNDHG